MIYRPTVVLKSVLRPGTAVPRCRGTAAVASLRLATSSAQLL